MKRIPLFGVLLLLVLALGGQEMDAPLLKQACLPELIEEAFVAEDPQVPVGVEQVGGSFSLVRIGWDQHPVGDDAFQGGEHQQSVAVETLLLRGAEAEGGFGRRKRTG